MNRPAANLAFSLFVGLGSLIVTVASAIKERWPVAIVFGLLAVGFLARGSERYRRDRDEKRRRR